MYQASMRWGHIETAVQVRTSWAEELHAYDVVLDSTGQIKRHDELESLLAQRGYHVVKRRQDSQIPGHLAHRLPQAPYLDQTLDKALVGLWITPSLSMRFRVREESDYQRNRYAALGINTMETQLARWLQRQKPATEALPQEIRDDLLHFQTTMSPLPLFRLKEQGYRPLRIRDRHTQQAWLVVRNAQRECLALLNLDNLQVQSSMSLSHEEPLLAQLEQRHSLYFWGTP
jgi:hypothetical protein